MTDRDDALLVAALLAQTGRARGPVPTDDELRAWSRQELTAARRAEVESHLARDARLLERAVALLGLPDSRPRPPPRAGWTLAAAAAIGAVAIAMTTLLRVDPVTPPRGDPAVYREARAVHPDWRVEAFRRGYRDHGAAAATPLADLDVGACLDQTCAAHARTLAQLGTWLARVLDECGRGAPGRDAGEALAAVHARMSGSIELAAWERDVAGLRRVLDGPPAAACEALARLRAARVD